MFKLKLLSQVSIIKFYFSLDTGKLYVNLLILGSVQAINVITNVNVYFLVTRFFSDIAGFVEYVVSPLWSKKVGGAPWSYPMLSRWPYPFVGWKACTTHKEP